MAEQGREILEAEADAVGAEIDLSFLPKELVSICIGVVHAHHERNGYRELMKDLSHKETLVCILVHRDLRELMGSIIACRRLSILCWALCGILLVTAIIWKWWVVIGIIPVLIVAYYLGRAYRSSGGLIAAQLLALEMANDDLVGLAKYLPSVWRTAHAKVEDYFPDKKTRFLDIYIPGRNELDQSELQRMIRDRVVPGAPS